MHPVTDGFPHCSLAGVVQAALVEGTPLCENRKEKTNTRGGMAMKKKGNTPRKQRETYTAAFERRISFVPQLPALWHPSVWAELAATGRLCVLGELW